MYLCMYVSM
jgi:hypothetical protein